MEKKEIEKLKQIAEYLRTNSLKTIIDANNGHIGGNMSSVELLTVLYFGGIFNFDPSDDKNENRDRVLIRGHEGPLRYNIFSLLKYIDPIELSNYRKFGSRLHGHEDMKETPGVDITPSGSLGMLLSYGVGSAISNKDKGIKARTIVFLGDGEEQEGNIAEAARHATTLNLNNLICIIDQNKKQLSRPTKESDGHDIEKIWNGYGWDVMKIKNGNDIEEVVEVYEKLKKISKPTIIIASTIKGYGVIGAKEHYSGYHTLSSVNDKKIVVNSYKKMKDSLDKKGITYDKISKIILNMISKPDLITFDKKTIISSVFDIKTKNTNISPQVAHENYLKELHIRIGDKYNKDIYYVTPDLYRKLEVEELKYNEFIHFIDTGIREQHTIAMCHGISTENPDARIFVCFGDAFVYRGLDQINAAVMGGSNMTIFGVWPGIEGGKNGKTHQTVSQPLALIGIPELNFYEPADSVDLYNILSKVLKENKGVNYIRLSKEVTPLSRAKIDKQNIDSYFVHKESEYPDLLIFASGFPLKNCIKAAKKLKISNNINVNVINIVNPKTIDKNLFKFIVNDAPILTVYNGSPQVLSNIISNSILLNPNIPRPKRFLSHGFDNGTTGSFEDLERYYGFDEKSIEEKLLTLLKK